MTASDRKALALLLLAVAVMYGPTLIQGRSLVDDPALLDVSFLIMPNLKWMAESWRLGQIPLWNPHTHGGMPHLAYTHSCALYPPAVLFYSLLPYVWAGSAMTIFHTLCAGFFFYLLGRQYRLPPSFALCASIVFIFSGLFFGMMYAVPMPGSACAFLALWLSLSRFRRRPTFSSFVASALATAWGTLAGDGELLTYGILTLFLLAFLEEGLSLRRLPRTLFLSGLPVSLGFLLVSPLLLPVMETVHFSLRGPLMPFPLRISTIGGPWQLALPAWFFPFRYFRHLLGPSAFNSGLPALYQGFLLPLLFWVAAAAALRRKEYRPLAVLSLFLFIFPLAREAGAEWWDRLPLVGSLKVSFKMLLLFQAAAILVGFRGLAELAHSPSRRWVRLLLSLLLLAGGMMLAGAKPWCWGGAERFVFGGASLAAGLALLFRRKGEPLLSPTAGAVIAAALIALEVFALAFRYHPRTDPRRFELAPELVSLARSLRPESRFGVFEQLLTEEEGAAVPIFGLFELASGANNLAGFSRVQPARIFLYLSRFYRSLIYTTADQEQYLDLWSIVNPGTLDRGRMHLLHLAGVSLILARQKPIPYASPYSLLQPHALEWHLLCSGPACLGSAEKNQLSLTGPGRLSADFHAGEGDELVLEGGGADAGWLIVSAQPSAGKKADLLMARFFVSTASSTLMIGLESFSPGAGLTLCWLPEKRKGVLLLQRLTKENHVHALQRVAELGPVEVFVNRDALPRAFVVHEVRTVHGWEEVMEVISDPLRFSAGREVVLEEETAEAEIVARQSRGSAVAGGREEVIFLSYMPNRVEMEARLFRPGFLVFTDTYFPGWEAHVWTPDGWRPTRIFPANLAFRAVFLPEGIHRLRWVYQPVSFRLGLYAGLATLLTLGAALCGLAALRMRVSRKIPLL